MRVKKPLIFKQNGVWQCGWPRGTVRAWTIAAEHRVEQLNCQHLYIGWGRIEACELCGKVRQV